MKTLTENTFEHFSKSNEYVQNKSILKIVFWCFIVIPFILLGKYSGIFPNLHIEFVISEVIVFIIGYSVSICLFKLEPYSPLIKYFILATIEIDVIILSFDSGLFLYIGYIIVPLISCIYLNKKFSIQVLVSCYVLMVISLIIRAIYIVPSYSGEISAKSWAIQFICSLSVEYFLNSIVVFIVSKRNSMTVDVDYKEVVKEFNSQNEITLSYVAMLSQKHPSLERHVTACSKYVSVICSILQKNKKYSDEFNQKIIFNYVTAAYLHDVGIISIPDSILNKATALTDKEKNLLKTHTILGNKLIKENMSEMDKDFLQIVCDMILYHHEQWDGNGYPYGIFHEEIPLAGRVISVANTLDNLFIGTYKAKGLLFEEAINKFSQMSGTVLDPDIVKEVVKNKEEIYKAYLSLQ